MRELLCFIDSLVHDEAYCARDIVTFERRARELQARTPSVQHVGEYALHHIAGLASPYLRSRIERPYTDAGLIVLGAGFRSTIYRKEDDPLVHKLHRGSVKMNDTDKVQLLESYRERQATTEYFLGQYALSQSFSVEPHPYLPDTSAVVGHQNYIEYSALPRDRDVLQPALRSRLAEFVGRSEEMALSTGYFVDIGGTDNLVVSDDNFLLIDTIPCDPQFAPDRVLANAQRNLADLRNLAGK